LADQAPVPLGAWDPARRCVYVNRCARALTGRSFDQALGDGWLEGVHADDLDRCLAAYDWAGETLQGLQVTHRIQARDEPYRWVVRRGLASVDFRGRFQGHVAFWLDVTERAAVEQALAQDKALCPSVLESLPGPAAVVGKRGRVLVSHGSWDPAEPGACAPDTNYREACRRASALGDREAGDALRGVEAVLAGQRERFVHEYPCPDAGLERWFELAVYPLRHPVSGVVLLRFEVTRRHWADASLQGLACGDHARTERALHTLLRQSTPSADGPKD